MKEIFLNREYFKNSISGVIHIGVNQGQESYIYESYGISNVIWIECHPETATVLQKNVRNFKNNMVINACISNKNDENIKFNISNNDCESSSFLNMKIHKEIYPDVDFINNIFVNTVRMSTLIEKQIPNFNIFNFLNIDVQGYELEVFKSFDNYINNFNYIYSEINFDHLYENCALVNEIDEYLFSFGFKRVFTKKYENFRWGEALYTK